MSAAMLPFSYFERNLCIPLLKKMLCYREQVNSRPGSLTSRPGSPASRPGRVPSGQVRGTGPHTRVEEGLEHRWTPTSCPGALPHTSLLEYYSVTYLDVTSRFPRFHLEAPRTNTPQHRDNNNCNCSCKRKQTCITIL